MISTMLYQFQLLLNILQFNCRVQAVFLSP